MINKLERGKMYLKMVKDHRKFKTQINQLQPDIAEIEDKLVKLLEQVPLDDIGLMIIAETCSFLIQGLEDKKNQQKVMLMINQKTKLFGKVE